MIEALEAWVRASGAPGVFAVLAIENLGVPWPTALAFVVAVELVRGGQMSFASAVLLCTLSQLAGSGVAYALGRAGDTALMRRLKGGTGIRRALEWLDRWYARYGSATVFGARLVGQVRPWASYAAGIGDVRPLPFLIWTSLGSAIQSAGALKLTQIGFSVWERYPQLRATIIAILALLFWGALAYAGWEYLRARRANRADRPGEPCCADDAPPELTDE